MYYIEHAAKKCNKTPNLSLYHCNDIRNVVLFTPGL